ncbi:chemotaxis protein [Mariprofundus sp. NF]|nr:chemotaxis protein [Mariprofundus sp. NF]
MLQVVIAGSEVLIRSSEIREVVRPLPLTKVPMGPDHILGLANIHGQIVSVIDAGKVSSLPSINSSDNNSSRARFLVLRHPVMHVGLRVDEVKRLRKVDNQMLNRKKNGDDAVYVVEIDGFTFDVLDTSKLFH